MTDNNIGKVKCSLCGYKCIEKNKQVEKEIHEEIGHPMKGERVKWI